MLNQKRPNNAHLSNRLSQIKFFSRAHKRKEKETMQFLLLEKITPAQFRSMYRELTSDDSVSDNQNSKEVNDRMKMICDKPETLQ